MFGGFRRVTFVVAPVAAWAVIGLAPVAEATSVTGMSPGFAPVGRTVTITGSGFTGAKDVTFNSVDAGPPTVVDDATLRTVVPVGATTGPLVVTDAAATQISAGKFYVQQPTAATIARSLGVAVFPHAVTIRASLRSAGTAVANQSARLQRSVIHSGTWRRVGDIRTTNSGGRVSWSITPVRSFAYRVVFAATRTHLGTTTSNTRVYVQPTITVSVPSVGPILTPIRATGRVRPASATGAVYLMRWRDGGWHPVKRATRVSAGHYAASFSMRTVGTYRYRLQRPSAHGLLRAASSAAAVTAVNRTLHSGMSGPDVTALQQRLRALHYDVGQINGSFGFDTQHAVVAFQKVQSMSRDGVVGPAVWQRLTAPRVPHLLHPLSNAAGVEVDLTHQVLYYGVDGHIRRIYDASTGGGYTYTGSDGQSHTAITPTGHFHIVYKRDGWVTAPLGTLYRPAYFNYDGYAIHGETEVPSYPASHGCVRITVPAMDRFNAKLPVGLSVWIYKI